MGAEVVGTAAVERALHMISPLMTSAQGDPLSLQLQSALSIPPLKSFNVSKPATFRIAAGADLVHFDVMDNHYVPNLTVGPVVCEAIRPLTKAQIDVHLMVKPVDRIVPDFAKAGANIISFHPEASDHVDRTIDLVRNLGCKVGLVFNPATPLAYL